MITDKEIVNAEKVWKRASNQLKFEIEFSYLIKAINGQIKVFAYLPNHGSLKGMLICLTKAPYFNINPEIVNFGKENGFHYSFINISDFQTYNEDIRCFIKLQGKLRL